MASSPGGATRGGVAGIARGALSLCLFIAGTALALYLLDVGCVFKTVTGLSCPGCGMTRAWLAALRLDLAAAVAYHPLFWVVPLAIALVCAQGPCAELVRAADAGEKDASPRAVALARALARLTAPVFLVLLIALLALWVVRLLDPADAGLLFGGTPPPSVTATDVVNWVRPGWLDWLFAH